MLVPMPDRDLAFMPTQRSSVDWLVPCELCSSYSQAAEELRGQNRELQARAEELDAFAQTVAHDLKGPLASLSGLALELQHYDGRLSAAQREECLDHLVRSAYKLNNIIDELLLLAQIRQTDVVVEP